MADADSKRRLRIAVVGSGMAGLVTAYLLHRDPRQRYSVTVFESGKTLSLDSASVSVPNPSRNSVDRVDLPMRAFAGGFYSNLRHMYDYLGVQYHSQPFLFSFAKASACERQTGHRPYFVHSSNNHRIPPIQPEGVGTLWWLAEIVYLAVCYLWWSTCCFLIAPFPATEERECESLDEYLRRIRLPQLFVSYFLLPLISSVSTCPHDALLRFPASDLTAYKKRTHGAQHYTVSNGVHEVQDKLVQGVEVRLSAAVSGVEPVGSGVKVQCKQGNRPSQTPEEEFFDQVVLAVPPDVVGQIFKPLESAMVLIPTTTVESIIHASPGDGRLGSKSVRTDPHSAQMIHLETLTEANTGCTESVHVQPSGVLVTTCPITNIDPAMKIRSVQFTRVLRTPTSRRIVNEILGDTESLRCEKQQARWTNGQDGVWLAGGWCWDGMVLLEGCVFSAMKVADAFDVEIPWRTGND